MRPVDACMRCGSGDLRTPSVARGDAFIPGTEDVMRVFVCRRCGLKGTPLSFDNEESRAAYERGRAAEGWADWKVTGQGSSPWPSASAQPKGYLAPGAFLAFGAFVFVVAASGGSLAGMAVGFAFAAIGTHLLLRVRARRRAASP